MVVAMQIYSGQEIFQDETGTRASGLVIGLQEDSVSGYPIMVVSPLAPAFRDTAPFTAEDAAEMEAFVESQRGRPARPSRTVPVDDDPTLY